MAVATAVVVAAAAVAAVAAMAVVEAAAAAAATTSRAERIGLHGNHPEANPGCIRRELKDLQFNRVLEYKLNISSFYTIENFQRRRTIRFSITMFLHSRRTHERGIRDFLLSDK
ncbi:uncharacterized protein LOC120358863 [Solenopsis invicta]|uniref:uncharacterized protein LOC120358863 n=1 Tax=Solenopsis invicta TaxID=13686 RepID=UPI00193CF4EF|nr:uncharacterized protein LOC120358863 [Solenopsis invicta]